MKLRYLAKAALVREMLLLLFGFGISKILIVSKGQDNLDWFSLFPEGNDLLGFDD